MYFRKTNNQDLEEVMKIINGAKECFKEESIDQWQKGYPNKETILKDICEENGYVLLEGESVIATIAVTIGNDPVYDKIYKGKWLSKEEYAVIRRVAVSSNYKRRGVSSKIIGEVEKVCKKKGINNIKIVTHEMNIPMQNMLKKNKFIYCGIVYLEDGSKRMAFEKLI
ncbi:MAG: GNAT family N-acetyltransferase [Clostridium sp.]|nr:GNAT family N-acetyltransferase [Clostridium sp.]